MNFIGSNEMKWNGPMKEKPRKRNESLGGIMKEKKTFYTMLQQIENVHLIKDVGMIPYMMYKECGYDAYIVSYGRSDALDYLNTEVIGLKLAVRSRYTGNSTIDGGLWLWKHAKQIDVLNLYHFRKASFFWILCYKLKNPKGKIYLKLDMDADAGIKMKMKPHTLKYFVTRRILGMCSVISCETRCFQEYAGRYWPVLIDYIPNGVPKSSIQVKNKKEKIILTAGRLGTRQKATEILIQAFEKAVDKISAEWKLYLAGTITEEMKRYIQSAGKQNPSLRSRIVVTGEIRDRNRLQELYKSSSIFTMPSRWESFGLVALEALARGNYLLLSNISSFRELTLDGTCGEVFEIDRAEEYAQKLIRVCRRMERQEMLIDAEKLETVLNEQFAWESICRKIDRLLKGGRSGGSDYRGV